MIVPLKVLLECFGTTFYPANTILGWVEGKRQAP
jgi:hypothetical protein